MPLASPHYPPSPDSLMTDEWADTPMDEELLGEVLAIIEPVKNIGHTEGLPENN